MNPPIRRTVIRLERDFENLHAFTGLAGRREVRISAWSIGEHLDHVMKVDRSILARIDSPIDTPHPPLSTLGRITLWTGWIPRGKGRAPDFTRPEAVPPEGLRSQIVEVRRLLHGVLDAPEKLADPRRIASHPHFGGLTAAQWLRFVAVHHRHHVKIIRDVLRADPA